MPLKLYNTLTRKKEVFKPLRRDRAGLYTCGPTVYNYAHIGNLRTYIFEDVLRRALEYAGWRVRHVMNITDVGHLGSDADTGDDKLEKGALREGKSVLDIARFYTDAFVRDIELLNIKRADTLVPATATIADQIALIKKLFAKGYAYETEQAVYFDISQFKNYTKLSGQKLHEKIAGARDEVITDPDKRHPQDFGLWFRRVGKFASHTMHWSSPWGDGFPGWHIECSAISSKYLGQPFDIHTGGVDHISVHHTNEIAQSEGAYGKPLAKFWMHGEFLLINELKMAKSEGNFYTLQTLIDKGVSPLAFRYLALTAHYRSKLTFTWESLGAANNSLTHLSHFLTRLSLVNYGGLASLERYKHAFDRALYNDLDTPKALAAVWTLVGDYNKTPKKFNSKAVLRFLYACDTVLGLGLKNIKPAPIPRRVHELAKKRDAYRAKKNWGKSDELRDKIKSLGYLVEDSPEGATIRHILQ